MNKELQDKAWSVLPREFKEEVKKLYREFTFTREGYYVELFGLHNLTSDGKKLSEPKPSEPRFKVGDKVVVHYSTGDRIGRIQEVLYDGYYDIDYGGGCTGSHIIESRLAPYTEPEEDKAEEIANKAIEPVEKHFDNILKDSFRNERRLNIATQIISSILSNQMMLNNLTHGETTVDGVVKCIVNTTMMYTDALIAECEEGGTK